MGGTSNKIESHSQLVEETLSELPGEDRLSELNALEIKGVATLLHNF